MNRGQVLLALCAWMHLAGVVWVCFLLPSHGDWIRKLDAASTAPLLLPLMVATAMAGWLSRDRPSLLSIAAVFALLDGLIWSSRWWF